ncbi:hypothetical protein [Agrococcus citreus]|uniref:protein-tyrosine-phosphatase n=1 Tax=Agrococcus citreus TaxID=84643 RepID=A0ABN1YS92_9MICO
MALFKRLVPPDRTTDDVFRVLAVCTGNICRSPQVEKMLRARVPAAFARESIGALSVSSAGTHASEGEPMDPYAVGEAARLGVHISGAHRSRRLHKRQLEEVDLVLGAERRHRDESAKLLRRRSDIAFTVIEFALIVEHLASSDAERVAPLGADGFAAFMRRVVSVAHDARAEALPRAAIALDLPDPYRYGPEVYRRSADTIDEHVTRIAAALRTLAAG